MKSSTLKILLIIIGVVFACILMDNANLLVFDQIKRGECTIGVFSGMVQPGHHRALVNLQHLGHLFVAEALDFTQNQDRTVSVAQGVKSQR